MSSVRKRWIVGLILLLHAAAAIHLLAPHHAERVECPLCALFLSATLAVTPIVPAVLRSQSFAVRRAYARPHCRAVRQPYLRRGPPLPQF